MLIVSESAANSQATRTWVSAAGDGANPCSRTTPCAIFGWAIWKIIAAEDRLSRSRRLRLDYYERDYARLR